MGVIMGLDPVEVFGSTPIVAYKFEVDIDNGTDMGSLSISLQGSHYGIPYGSFLGDSLEVQTRSM